MRSIPLSRIACDFAILLILWIPIPLAYYYAEPYTRGFFCGDVSIRYPLKKGTVSSGLLYSVGTILPTVTIAVVEAYRIFKFEPRAFRGGESVKPNYKFLGKPVHPYLSSLYVYLGYFYFGMAVNFIFTDLGKYTIGRPRPHFIAACQPDWNLLNCSRSSGNTVEFYNYVIDPHCTTKDLTALKHARLSFPSGHSSFSAYTMVYLVLYLHSRMIWPTGGFLLKHFLQLIAMILTVETSLSRVSDYKHHWSDVLAGFLLGVIDACIVAFYMAGLFRRPQSIFADPSPFDSRHYTGAQLYGEFTQDETKEAALAMVEKKAVEYA